MGVVATDRAIQMARQQDLDLVEVAPNADPPVARLLDYGKLRYLYAVSYTHLTLPTKRIV